MTIRFLEDVEVTNHERPREVVERHHAGEVTTLAPASERYWINRGAAVDLEAAEREAKRVADAKRAENGRPPPAPRKRGSKTKAKAGDAAETDLVAQAEGAPAADGDPDAAAETLDPTKAEPGGSGGSGPARPSSASPPGPASPAPTETGFSSESAGGAAESAGTEDPSAA